MRPFALGLALILGLAVMTPAALGANEQRRPQLVVLDMELIERANTLTDEARVRLWLPFIAPSLKALHEENRKTSRSLGTVRPDPGSLKFFCKPAKNADSEDRDVADAVQQTQQGSLVEDPLKPLEKSEYAFGYRFTSAGHSHTHIIHDWEVQAAYRSYKLKYGSRALDQLTREYSENIPKRNLHFLLGTIAAHPRLHHHRPAALTIRSAGTCSTGAALLKRRLVNLGYHLTDGDFR